MKLSRSIKSIAVAAVLAASASSTFAALTAATVSGSFSNQSLGSFDVLSLSNVAGSLGFAPTLEFPFGSLTLGPVTFSGGSVGTTYTFTGNTFSFANVAAGTYSLSASGSVSGGGYGLIAAQVAVTPVPEPESYAMMLAGLGFMGAIARRRARKDQA
jgi:hypothetical protein